ncbi:Histone ubiquitination proteins group [Tripterygium wilfordii]|uniref:E3 ubiquitin protein ligase n=1 Tax=Tripterygium wilfordii TaxID=458696 RepID=A0A7J7DD93_TRIWF|nr:E3 ubiquitin-protein ligase BRE1-like 1 isoform X2 [Tripterygium wilfordii]KAF5744281.1 Histone ubiquitination proteins group [Tripterygium wilfordii]
MGSTGEHDRKRRHFSPISPTETAAAKKQSFAPISEEKKLDAAVLQFQNQKLVQKLQAQKVEYSALENKLSQIKEKQQPYESTLKVIDKSWEALITDLETSSIHTRESNSGQDVKHVLITDDGASSPFKDAFLSRLCETGATESSSANICPNRMEEDDGTTCEKIRNILGNIVTAIDNLWNWRNGLHSAVLKELPVDGSCKEKASRALEIEVKSLRPVLSDLHLKHKSLARELQSHRDMDARNKAELKRLKGELGIMVAELEDSNRKLGALKAERDATKGAFFPVLNSGSKHVSNDRVRDKKKDMHDMECALKELSDQTASRLLELRGLHEERIKILQHLSDLRNKLKSVKSLSSSQAYLLVKGQLEKSRFEVLQYQALYEKLQAEKDSLLWKEKELHIKNDLVDVSIRSSAVADSRISELEVEIEKQISERNMIQSKFEEASREPGRKEIIAEFKTLLSSFPEEMGTMQSQLSKYKESTSDIHSLRADVKSLSDVVDRKVKECEHLSLRSADQVSEMRKLQAVVQDLKESELELKLILEMYRRESSDSRDVLDARDSEYMAWAHVQSLKSSLDEQNLELRVKTANEAEAVSQQRLAAAEAEIADLRQKLEGSKRNMSKLSDAVKSKNEENEAYLSEIETIGQAYDDMQTQNQQLLQQITERDDYNIKLVVQGVRARQQQDALLMDKRKLNREIQLVHGSVDFYLMKTARIEDQLRICSDQIQRLGEDRLQKSSTLENTQKRLLDVRMSSNQLRENMEESQSKVEGSRAALLELRVELDRERFDKRRIEEELEVARRKLSRLRVQIEGSSTLEKLRQELREYKEILKCSICLDRPKEVVITKCYHLFCNPCVHRIIESRHRKCPACSASFGPNDVKPVYI